MDDNYDWNNPTFKNRCGDSLNLAMNHLIDVLHSLYISSDLPNTNGDEPQPEPPPDNGGDSPQDTTAPDIGNVGVGPSSGSLGTPFTISVAVSDPSGVKSVVAHIQNPDETNVAILTLNDDNSDGTYIGTWDSTGASLGTYLIDIVATDNLDNSGEGENIASCNVLKSSTILSCFVSSSSITIGNTVTISGSITPALSGKVVTLTYTKPDSSTVTRTCTTNPGDYTDIYTPDSTGIWSVKASWDGDATYSGAFSALMSFTVSKLSSSISCSISASELTIGESTIISGSILSVSSVIQPPSAISVTLSYRINGVWTPLATVTSTADGSYSYTWTPTQVNSYQLRASWSGDSFFKNAISSEVSVTVSKYLTSLSCSVSSSEVTGEDAVTISGAINPKMSGTTVTLTYTKPDSSTVIRTISTTSKGNYSDAYTPNADGLWSVTASWDGDSTHEGSTSTIQSFTVNRSPIGGPGWTEEIIIIGGIGLALVSLFIFLRSKTTKNSIWR
jgi:hypothetical protein